MSVAELQLRPRITSFWGSFCEPNRDRGGAASRVSAGGGEVSSTMSSTMSSRMSRGRGHGDTSRDTCVKIKNVNFASTHRLKKRLVCKLNFCGYVDSRYIITWAEWLSMKSWSHKFFKTYMNEINGNVFYSFDHLQTILHLKYHAGSQVDRLPQGSVAPSFFHHTSL